MDLRVFYRPQYSKRRWTGSWVLVISLIYKYLFSVSLDIKLIRLVQSIQSFIISSSSKELKLRSNKRNRTNLNTKTSLTQKNRGTSVFRQPRQSGKREEKTQLSIFRQYIAKGLDNSMPYLPGKDQSWPGKGVYQERRECW